MEGTFLQVAIPKSGKEKERTHAEGEGDREREKELTQWEKGRERERERERERRFSSLPIIFHCFQKENSIPCPPMDNILVEYTKMLLSYHIILLYDIYFHEYVA